MQEYKKDYRKYSYSENNIKDLPKDIILSIQEITNPPIKSEEITNLPKKKSKYSYYIFKRFNRRRVNKFRKNKFLIVKIII